MAISVIIPIYNVEAYIEDCLKSVICQTCLEKGVQVECILVDDCGNDRSMDICERFIESYTGLMSFQILHHEHNRGLSAARNTGMEVAKGEYVFFVDSDDQLTPACLELLYAQAEATHADMTFGAFETFGDRERVHHPHGKPYVMAWNKLCRRRFLLDNNIRFIEGLIHEDCPWSFEIECKARQIAMVPEVTYRYLIREGGLQTAGDFDRHFRAYQTILRQYAETIAESISAKRKPAGYLTEWFEVQKALYFSMTVDRGSDVQIREMYHLIRLLKPLPKFCKADSHYWLPEFAGIFLYRKFYKYHLC